MTEVASELSGPADPHDPTLASLRREARRQGRSGRWMAGFLVMLGLGLMMLLVVALPAQFAQSVGLAEHHQAVVESIALSTDQPNKGSVRKSGAAWDVHVRWDDGRTVLHNSGMTRSKGQPYQVGQQITVATAGDAHAVSFRSTKDAVESVVIMLVLLGVFVAVAMFYWHGSRAWRGAAVRVCSSAPRRVLVDGAPVPHRRRESRVDVHQRGQLVNYRDADDTGDTGSLLVLNAGHGRVVRADDELDVWSVTDTPGPPFAVRRASDGVWWLGSASN